MKNRIVIIEDSDLNREVLRDLLIKEYDLIECKTGEEGLEIINNTDNIACILLDLVLPNMSGIDVLKSMSKKDLDLKPVIVISASSNSFEQQEAFLNGAFDYILKPFDLQNVLHRIRNTIFAKNRLLELHKELTDVKHNANYDGLTGVYNRGKCEELIRNYIEENPNEALGLLVFDLDNFKLINDLQGHHVGDIALKKVAKLISTYFRPYDFIGRLGGDEFFVLMTKLSSKNDLETKALDIVRMLHFKPNITVPANASVSIGGVFKDKNDNYSFDDMYKMADKALYQAKNDGKNRFVMYGDEQISDKDPDTKVLMITRNRSLSEMTSMASRSLDIKFQILDYGNLISLDTNKNNVIMLDITEDFDYSNVINRIEEACKNILLVICVPEFDNTKLLEALKYSPASIMTLPTSIDTIKRNIKRLLN